MRYMTVDRVRNGRAQTTATAFSARARPGVGVSMPVSWEQLLNSRAVRSGRRRRRGGIVVSKCKTRGKRTGSRQNVQQHRYDTGRCRARRRALHASQSTSLALAHSSAGT